MSEIHRDRFHTLTRIPGRRTVLLSRSATPFETTADIDESFARLHPILESCKRMGLTLLVDSRQAPARVDAAFDEAHGPHRARCLSGFGRVAILVLSLTGRWQMSRQRSRVGQVQAFDNEADALEFLGRSDATEEYSGVRPAAGAFGAPAARASGKGK